MDNARRRPGRPRREPPTAVHVKLPPGTYDAAFRAAARAHVTVPELVRRALDARLADEPASTVK